MKPRSNIALIALIALAAVVSFVYHQDPTIASMFSAADARDAEALSHEPRHDPQQPVTMSAQSKASRAEQTLDRALSAIILDEQEHYDRHGAFASCGRNNCDTVFPMVRLLLSGGPRTDIEVTASDNEYDASVSLPDEGQVTAHGRVVRTESADTEPGGSFDASVASSQRVALRRVAKAAMPVALSIAVGKEEKYYEDHRAYFPCSARSCETMLGVSDGMTSLSVNADRSRYSVMVQGTYGVGTVGLTVERSAILNAASRQSVDGPPNARNAMPPSLKKPIDMVALAERSTAPCPGEPIIVPVSDYAGATRLERLLLETRAVPFFRDRKRIGLRLFAIKPESIFGRLGFQNGDIVTFVNGSAQYNNGFVVFPHQHDPKAVTRIDFLRGSEPEAVCFTVNG